MMKVLHIVGNSKFGGASIPILRLAQLAQSMEWDVEVLTQEKRFINMLAENHIKTVEIEVIWREIKPFKDLRGLYDLYRFLKKSNYTLVHTHTSKAGFVGRLAAKLAGVPVIIHTVHGFSFHEESSERSLAIYSSLERLAATWCDRLVLLTEFHRQWALRLGIGNSQKNVVIPNWIQPERLQPQPSFSPSVFRKSLVADPNTLIILCAGRLAVQKGHEYLIKAVPFLVSHLSKPLKIMIVGEGDLKPQLEQLVEELGIKDYVSFLGFCDNVENFLSVSDLVVLPSLWEGLSISLLEAMAMGKPIITTTIGSNLEVLENRKNALLVPAKDPNTLGKVILELADNPDLGHTLGEEAKKTFAHRYTKEIQLNRYKALYLEAIQEKNLTP